VAPVAEPPDSGAAAQDAEPDAYEVARAIALRSLDAAPRSRHQLGERLARKGVAPEVAERVLDRFTEVGLLDDVAYARMLVSSRRASRGLAPRALALELRRAGIADDTAAAVLAELEDGPGETDEELAASLVRKRLRSMRGLDHEVALRRLVGMLARKGYSPALAARVAREMLRSEGETGHDVTEDRPGVAERGTPTRGAP